MATCRKCERAEAKMGGQGGRGEEQKMQGAESDGKVKDGRSCSD